MTTRWYPVEECDDSLLTSASVYLTRTVDVPYPAEETWAALTDDSGPAHWTKGVKRLTWTSPRPFGVGTTREVETVGGFALRERFYRWDEGHRKTFTVVGSTHNVFKRLVEDYVVESTPEGSRLTWQWAGDLHRPWSFMKPVLKKLVLEPTAESHIGGLPAHMASTH
ncbi:Polyketide cyclase / dehydrase and lipid transport [Streptomyces sp. yr375]|uniref:SRPBCC family protein n=1 Tax=Streptomyces sp. yr375 TaxID=1761906 RepID=UPI0008C869D4|nr:SRPBCC family protein [Streptomyces sp. yr375]SEQ90787.1 Polyketide cyclase / dehydrase and lipid transport [Streptomyces sp. yr375]